MLLSWILILMISISILCAAASGQGAQLAAAVLQGAQSGVTLTISLAGSLCLWSGVCRLMEAGGLTERISGFLRPLLTRLFPEAQSDPILCADLSTNICANLLGLGNAATAPGIRATRRMAGQSGSATDSLCRLIVLNTASIQLIPATVAAIRSGAGAASPFDILPAVWITSLCSATAGLAAAFIMGRLWK